MTRAWWTRCVHVAHGECARCRRIRERFEAWLVRRVDWPRLYREDGGEAGGA